jgi:hypothetical protein
LLTHGSLMLALLVFVEMACANLANLRLRTTVAARATAQLPHNVRRASALCAVVLVAALKALASVTQATVVLLAMCVFHHSFAWAISAGCWKRLAAQCHSVPLHGLLLWYSRSRSLLWCCPCGGSSVVRLRRCYQSCLCRVQQKMLLRLRSLTLENSLVFKLMCASSSRLKMLLIAPDALILVRLFKMMCRFAVLYCVSPSCLCDIAGDVVPCDSCPNKPQVP